MSYGQIHRRSPEEAKRHADAFVAALTSIKRDRMRDRAHRIGPWLFAFHRTIGMTWRPRLDRWPGQGWSLWWFWFEIAFLPIGHTGEHQAGALRDAAFIAAANPQAILSLIEENERMREGLNRIISHRIGRDPPTVWTGSDLCRKIATEALGGQP